MNPLRRTSVREIWNPAPDLHNDELGELSDLIKFAVQHKLVSVLGRGEGEFKRLENVRSGASEFILKDTVTGFFIKGTSGRIKDVEPLCIERLQLTKKAVGGLADAEFGTMNYLHAMLAQKKFGVSAVRYVYMATPKDQRQPSVSIVEPADGKTLSELDLMGQELREQSGIDSYSSAYASLLDVKSRLRNALTHSAACSLASDLNAGNVLLGPDDCYTIIDQPHPYHYKSALRWLDDNS